MHSILSLATLTALVAPAASSSESLNSCLRLRVATVSSVPPDTQYALPLVLEIWNGCKVPVYLSPVIGAFESSLTVYARPVSGEPIMETDELILVTKSHSSDSSYQDADLFKLLPRRTLRREWEIPYDPIIKGKGVFELWVELDTRDMKRGSEKAFAGLLVSNKRAVTVRK